MRLALIFGRTCGWTKPQLTTLSGEQVCELSTTTAMCSLAEFLNRGAAFSQMRVFGSDLAKRFVGTKHQRRFNGIPSKDL